MAYEHSSDRSEAHMHRQLRNYVHVSTPGCAGPKNIVPPFSARSMWRVLAAAAVPTGAPRNVTGTFTSCHPRHGTEAEGKIFGGPHRDLRGAAAAEQSSASPTGTKPANLSTRRCVGPCRPSAATAPCHRAMYLRIHWAFIALQSQFRASSEASQLP